MKTFIALKFILNVLNPHKIERILSSIHLDERTGLFTLLTLYRFERDKPFTMQDKQLQKQALYHLLTAAKHALFLQLEHSSDSQNTAYKVTTYKNSYKAICDNQGYFHQVQTSFIDLLERCYGNKGGSSMSMLKLPFTLDLTKTEYEIDGLQVKLKSLKDLFLVEIWPQGPPLDSLSQREREIVQTLAKGLTFKEAARELGLSPSTVSNHLYRVYQKLNIGSKSELLQLLV